MSVKTYECPVCDCEHRTETDNVINATFGIIYGAAVVLGVSPNQLCEEHARLLNDSAAGCGRIEAQVAARALELVRKYGQPDKCSCVSCASERANAAKATPGVGEA